MLNIQRPSGLGLVTCVVPGGNRATVCGSSRRLEPHEQRNWYQTLFAIVSLTLVSTGVLMACGLAAVQCAAVGLLVGVAGQRVLVMFKREDDIFSPVNLMALYFLVNFGVRATYLLLDSSAVRVGVLYYDDYISLALLYATLGFVSFWAGTRSFVVRRIAHRFSNQFPTWSGSMPFFRALVVYAVGVIGTLYLFNHGARTVGNLQEDIMHNKYAPMPGAVVLMATLINLGFAASAVFLFARQKRLSSGFSSSLLLILGAALIVGVFSLTAKKSSILEPLVAGLIGYHYLRGRMTLGRLLAVCVPVFLSTFGALNIYRYSIIGAAGGAPRNLADVVDRVEFALGYFQADRNSDLVGGSVLSFLQREFGVDSLALVVKYTPERKEFGLGKHYAEIPAQVLIPRLLWPDKPIDYFTGEFEDTYAVGWKDAYTSPHVISDLYQNFHVFGIIGGMFLIGVVLQSLYVTCRPWLRRPEGVFIYAVMMPGLILALEWEPVSVCQYYLRYSLLVFCLTWFLSSGSKIIINPILSRHNATAA